MGCSTQSDIRRLARMRTRSSYLVEFRFSGFAKKTIRELTAAISKNFGVKGATRHRVVPHITIAGPLSTNDEKKLVKEVKNVVKKHDLVEFRIDNFGNFGDNVIHVNILPSPELIEMRQKIVENLEKFCRLQDHDYVPNYKPHATLAMKDISRKFDKIAEFLDSWKIPNISQHVLRVTIIKDSRILCEYDLILGKMLERREALDREVFKKTMAEYGKKRDKHGIKDKKPIRPEELSGKVFVASDMHFDHSNIIRYCDRPFRDAREMNRTLVENWNRAVGEHDRVYYLGDMAHGRDRRPIDFWLAKLNGDICFIRGSHDTDIITRAKVLEARHAIRYKGYEFLLMHDPYRPSGWDGWIIHGDKHNNDRHGYPGLIPHHNDRNAYLDDVMRNKTINACAEWTGYAPLDLDFIISRIT